MAKKKVKGTKTDRIINLILEISNAKGWTISEQRLKELLGNPSDSQFYIYLAELTADNADRPAILIRIKGDEGFFYKLHDRTWENFFMAQEEGEYLLECHKKLGYLIENGLHDIDLIDTKSNRNNLSRKFFYLSAVQGKAFDEETKEIMQTLIQSLLSNKQLSLLYSKKSYKVLPLSLVQYRDELYLLGYKEEVAEKNIRTFKINRIESANLLKEKFKYPSLKVWNPVERYKDASGLIVGKPQSATIQVYGNARKLLKEKDFFQNQLLANYKSFDQYKVTFTNEHEFLGQLFVYADEIEIIQPESLRNFFIEKAENALALNRVKKAA